MFFNWILFIGAVGAYFKKGNIENYQKRLTEKQAKISRLSEISVNPESEKYFNNAQLVRVTSSFIIMSHNRSYFSADGS